MAKRTYKDRQTDGLDIENRNKYTKEYIKENYSRVTVYLHKEEKEVFQAFAKENGYDSLSSFFVEMALKRNPKLRNLLNK